MSNRQIRPPRLADKLFLWYCRSASIEDLHGDIEELFYVNLKTHSRFRASMKYWFDVLSLMLSYAMVKRKRNSIFYSHPTSFLHSAMLKSYFKVALRNFINNKGYSFINITGLSIGMAVAIAISLWVWDELTFDTAHRHRAKIAQVYQNVTNNGEVQTWTTMPWPLAEELRKNYGDDFEQVVLTTGTSSSLVTTPTKKLMKVGIFAEPGFVELFSLQMVAGSENKSNDPSSILLSQSAATAYFGDNDPINQVLKIDEQDTYKVIGVFKNLPPNSTLADVDFIASWEKFRTVGWMKQMEDPWRPNSFTIYVRLADNSDFVNSSLRIKDAKLKKVNEQLAKKKPALFLHPMSQWHLHAEFRNGMNTGGRIQYVWLFGIIGAFVLLMACINFMNLTTAKSEQRAKEIGIRKSIGSWRGQLITQFFSEATLVAMLSFFLGLLMVALLLPSFNELMVKQIELPWTNFTFWSVGFGLTLLTGIVSGSYPALYLSSIQPGQALKGTFRSGKSAGLPRKILVVLQFTISVILIVGTVTVYEQIRYAQNRPIGYNREALVTIPMISDGINNHFHAFQQELEKTGAIVESTIAGVSPADVGGSSSGFDWNGKDPNLSVDFNFFRNSSDYGKTLGWTVLAGRDFNPAIISDSSAVIVNEAAANYMGFKDPIGETVRWFGEPQHVIGVVNDIVFRSPYEPVRPSVYTMSRNNEGNALIVRLNPKKSATQSLQQIERAFKQYNPEEPFVYHFADEEYARKFGDENRIGKLASIFTVLAIVISCLGIFGLASFVAERRTKEIGIRKILGASILSLWGMLSKEFVILVLVALSISIPIGWYAMHQWLEKFIYRTEMAWWIFLAAGIGALGITLLTVSFQSIKTAMANPITSLRSE